MEYSIKGEKARLDMTVQGMNTYTLFDAGTKTMDMVMPTRQMYFERAIQNAHARADSAADKTRFTRTGRKEPIAGYECEHATITSANGPTTDVCLAKGLGAFVQMGGGTRERNDAMGGGWEDAVGKTFPLKVQKGDHVVMEATRVEKEILDPSLFAVPDGYQKMGVGMEMGGRGGR
jgi:Domain of unknown function (DUF4412)